MTKEFLILDDYWDLKEDPYYPFESNHDDSKSNPNPWLGTAYNENYEKLKSLEKEIQQFSEEWIKSYKATLIDEILLLKNVLEKSRLGRRISRNQALVVDNAVYAKIIRAIKSCMRFTQVSLPELYRTNVENDMLQVDPLIIILEEALQELKSLEPHDYFSIERVVESLIEEIKNQWEIDNLAMAEFQKA